MSRLNSPAEEELEHNARNFLPPLAELIESANVVSIPLNTTFRGQKTREVMIFRGPEGATEFSPFLEYGDREAARWLAASLSFGWCAAPPILRNQIMVNATLPAVPLHSVESVLDKFSGCRTVKVKVAEPGQSRSDERKRVAAVREYLGPAGRIRLDANGGWNIDEAESAIHDMAEYDLEYIEQPCETVTELHEIRRRVAHLGIPIAADESVRKADDPLDVIRRDAADIVVLKAQPLGGIHEALTLARNSEVSVVISSALETSLGIAMGAHLAACIPNLEYDCGLGTVALLTSDVVSDSLVARNGSIPVIRPSLDENLVLKNQAAEERKTWWNERLVRCYSLLEEHKSFL